MPKLVIFLSYATKDQQLATTIANKLSSAFGRAVDLRYMAKFELGVNFRTTIDQALDSADILLVIATGREKLSHTFTGYEVGYFRRSQQTRPYVEGTQEIGRLIIPVAIFADTPTTISEIEGIGIGQGDRFFFTLVDGKLTAQKADPLFSLLDRIDGILAKTDPDGRSIEQRKEDYDRYKATSHDFYAEISELMSTLPLEHSNPKTKIVVRLPSGHQAVDAEINSQILFSQSGPTTGIFLRTIPVGFYEWKEFMTFVGEDEVALSWKDALTNLISSVTVGDFTHKDEIVFSYDRSESIQTICV